MDNQKNEINLSTIKKVHNNVVQLLSAKQKEELRSIVKKQLDLHKTSKDKSVKQELNFMIKTLALMTNEIGLKGVALSSVILYAAHKQGHISIEKIADIFGQEISEIVIGLKKVDGLTANSSSIASSDYVKLLITMAEDLRVILIRIATALCYMREINLFEDNFRLDLAMRVKHLYAPLAHKLGLHRVKTEMEDLYLLYTDKEAYEFIVQKLKDSEKIRNRFIADFIKPIEEKLKQTTLKYDIKGRVKSISSINNKLQKQKIEFESIYDIFAIRLILDSPLPSEKAECWQAYSLVTDLYTPNPKRLKDWLSIPKSNGYESLHTTVMGPEHKWVEVQIRTKRMDEIAERGLAAHWKYKGIKSQSRVDDWLTNLREVLENQSLDTNEKLEDFRLDIYEDEIYVFTPKGDLHTLPNGATVLDFAFSIHTKVGSTCISGKVNNKNVPIKYQLKNGDQVEIVTSPNQSPKQDWLAYVHTSKARNKIRQSLKEEANKQVQLAKELLQRRFKNRKMEMNESILMKTVKKHGFKQLTDFYIEIANEKLDVNNFLDQYSQLEKKETETDTQNIVSAENYVPINNENDLDHEIKDELILDKNLTGIEYQLAKCCNPIFGDDVFGFVSTQGIKIHRKNCPNAHDMFTRFNYRIIPARWTGVSASSYLVTLKIVGYDDISIVNNITSLISKEEGINMRSISIDSNDSLFHGTIAVKINDLQKLKQLMKKMKGIKGVRDVSRIN